MNITEAIKRIMCETGRIGYGWRIELIGTEPIGCGDYTFVNVKVYKPRSRKPDVSWHIFIDTIRSLIYWDRSTFVNLK